MYRAKPSRLKEAEGQEVFLAFFVCLFLRELRLLKCPELSYNERNREDDKMDFNQQENKGELLFDHTVRLSHRFGMRLVSACLIAFCLYILWTAINATVLMFGLYLGVDGLTLMKVMVVVLVLSIVLLAIVGWRHHRKTWLKKLRIIDLGD